MSKTRIAGTYDVSAAPGYAGDVTPATAWKILSENKDAVLIDCLAHAQGNYVGRPGPASIGKWPAVREWQVFPSMQHNPEFVTPLGNAVTATSMPLLFLC